MLWLSWPSCILLVVLLMTSSAQPKIVSTDVGSLVFKRWPLELILRSVRRNLIRLFLQRVSCCAYRVCRPLDGFSYRGSNPPCLPSRGPTWLIWEQTWPFVVNNIQTWNISERVEDIWTSDSNISAFSGLPDWNLSFFILLFVKATFPPLLLPLSLGNGRISQLNSCPTPLTHFLVRPPLVLILIRIVFMKILGLFTCSYESYIILHSRIASCVLHLGKV